MPRSTRRHPKPDRRRALELLASSPDGCTEAIMLAHGFTGLASVKAEHMVAGSQRLEIARVKITAAGRKALAGTFAPSFRSCRSGG